MAVNRRFIRPGISTALLPVKSSAPRITTRIRPIGNMQPLSSRCSEGLPAVSPGNPKPMMSERAPPKAMKAPAWMAWMMVVEGVRLTFAPPASSVASVISLGVRSRMM